MKTLGKWMVVVGISIQFLASSAFGYHAKITINQVKAREYIAALQEGADPDSLTRPQLRHDKHSKMKRSKREIIQAMDEAEALARAGRYDLIEQPEFMYNGVPEDQLMSRQREKEKNGD